MHNYNIVHLKRLCSYLKQYQTIYRMGRLTKIVKLKGTECNKKHLNTKYHKTSSFSEVQSWIGADSLFGCPKTERWLGCSWGANGIGITCIRFRSTSLSSFAHMNETTTPKLPTCEWKRGQNFFSDGW